MLDSIAFSFVFLEKILIRRDPVSGMRDSAALSCEQKKQWLIVFRSNVVGRHAVTHSHIQSVNE